MNRKKGLQLPPSLLVTIMTLVLTPLVVYSEEMAFKSWGESCDVTTPCNPDSQLECDLLTGTCDCARLDRNIYDGVLGKCVTRLGHYCSIPRPYNPSESQAYNQGRIEVSSCMTNAICNPSGICKCQENYLETPDGNSCFLPQTMGQSCDVNLTCSTLQGLVCTEMGTCECNTTVSKFGTAKKHTMSSDRFNKRLHEQMYVESFNSFEGPDLSQCIGLAGSPCINHLCVPKSYCARFSRNYPEPNKCVCQAGYSKSKVGTCGRSFMEPCEDSGDCHEGLVCQQNRCGCLYDNQVFNSTSQSCLSRIGGPCSFQGTESQCVEHAKCVLSSSDQGQSNGPAHCQCEEGFVRNLVGKCDVQHGRECSSTKRCDEVAGLVCTNKICQCKRFAKYDEEAGKCLGLAGAPCEVGVGHECVGNATCQKVRKWVGIGQCECQGGFKETKGYTCRAEGEKDPEDETTTTSTTTTTTEAPVEVVEEEAKVDDLVVEDDSVDLVLNGTEVMDQVNQTQTADEEPQAKVEEMGSGVGDDTVMMEKEGEIDLTNDTMINEVENNETESSGHENVDV